MKKEAVDLNKYKSKLSPLDFTWLVKAFKQQPV